VKPLLVALLVASVSVVASPAHAADAAVCSASMPFALNPPVTLATPSFTYSTQGPSGTITCYGFVNGSPVTGSGTLVNQGTSNGNCAQGMGDGEFLARIPTAGGTVAVSGTYTFRYTGVLGSFSGPAFSGTFQFVPTAGNCVTAPMTQVLLLAQGILTT
jgi:hypothetical protein